MSVQNLRSIEIVKYFVLFYYIAKTLNIESIANIIHYSNPLVNYCTSERHPLTYLLFKFKTKIFYKVLYSLPIHLKLKIKIPIDIFINILYIMASWNIIKYFLNPKMLDLWHFTIFYVNTRLPFWEVAVTKLYLKLQDWTFSCYDIRYK